MMLIENQAGMTREYSRIFLKVILSLERPLKVYFWISKLDFSLKFYFWRSELILLGAWTYTFGCLNLYFECLNLYFGCLNLYFGWNRGRRRRCRRRRRPNNSGHLAGPLVHHTQEASIPFGWTPSPSFCILNYLSRAGGRGTGYRCSLRYVRIQLPNSGPTARLFHLPKASTFQKT